MFNDLATFKESPGTPNYFFSVDPDGLQHKPAGNYLVAYTNGYYGNTNSLVKHMMEYIEENNLETVGPVYNIFLLDGVSVRDHEDFLMQCSVKVKD
jgi:effector-binding domain-containing protein